MRRWVQDTRVVDARAGDTRAVDFRAGIPHRVGTRAGTADDYLIS